MDKQFIEEFLREYNKDRQSPYLCNFISRLKLNFGWDIEIKQLIERIRAIEQDKRVGINKFLFNNGFMSTNIPYINEQIIYEIEQQYKKTYRVIAKEARVKWLRSLITE